jgi:hypothetical protein
VGYFLPAFGLEKYNRMSFGKFSPAPSARRTIAHRFNGGNNVPKRDESRQGRKKTAVPGGTRLRLLVGPTDKSVGYFLSRQRRFPIFKFEHAHLFELISDEMAGEFILL